MTVVYSIDTSKYDPISHGSNYLYNQFDRIQSFLVKQNADRYRNILAKPVLSNGQVLWYANYNQPFSRITDLSEDQQFGMKATYWQFRQQIDAEIQQLSISKEIEKQNWANLLKEVFNEDDNVILSDGQDWCLLWGWKFRNMRENYLSPEFMPKSRPSSTSVTGVSDYGSTTLSGNQPVSNSLIDPEQIPVIPASNASRPMKKPGFWLRVKHFLRRLVYRLWGLLLLIMFILFIACLFKTCQNKKMAESCRQMEMLNQKLNELDKKVQDRCIEPK